MSARTEVHGAMKMLIVKTMRVPMIVPAEMDSLATARRVAVSSSNIHMQYTFHMLNKTTYI